MKYNKKQIDAAVAATSPMCFILHVTGAEYCDAVFVAMQLSSDSNGELSQQNLNLITELMP